MTYIEKLGEGFENATPVDILINLACWKCPLRIICTRGPAIGCEGVWEKYGNKEVESE